MVTMDCSNLVVQSQQGDPEAYEALIREYQNMIHALCYRMTGTRDDADDLAQETFISAFERLGTFRGEAQFSSWLYRIAVNRCLNWRKEKERRERLHRDWSNEETWDTSSGQIRRAELIQDALLKLAEKQRAAVILTTYEGLSHGEAAKALGCSETTVSWRVFAARRKLKRLLKELLQNEHK